MIDLDHFKSVNDTYGHPAGDKVIKALAHLLRQRLRKTDSIGRYGGEEFVAVLPGCDATEARGLLDDVRQNFKEINFSVDTKHFTVTLSAGLACTELSSTLTADTLLQMADDALYLAKHGGRDQICIAE
jgi:diguanylate cyclase (GGDEF)-like protein